MNIVIRSCAVLAALLFHSVALSGVGEWDRIGLGGGSPFTLAIDPADPSILLAGTPNGIFKSTDHGETWFESSSDELRKSPVHCLAVSASSPRTVYAATADSIHRSQDGGGSWTKAGSVAESVSDLIVDPRDPFSLLLSDQKGRIYRSITGGAHWTLVHQPPESARQVASVRKLTAAASDLRIVYAASAGEILKSANGGSSWVRADDGIQFLQDDEQILLSISPTNPLIVTAVFRSGAFKTLDGGQNWVAVPNLPAGATIVAPAPSDPQVVYAGGSRVYRSDDGGDTWQDSLPFPSSGRASVRRMSVLEVDPLNPMRVYAANESGLFRSEDGGVRWKRLHQGLFSAVQSLAFDPANPLTLYAGTLAGVAKSVDGGRNWTVPVMDVGFIPRGSPIVLPDSRFQIFPSNTDGIPDLHVLSNNPRRLLAGGDSIVRSEDGGNSWTPVGSSSAFDLAELRSGTLISASLQGVEASKDGGRTWAPSGEGMESCIFNFCFPTAAFSIAADPADGNVLYAGTSDGVFKSVDGAQQWQKMNSGITISRPTPFPLLDPELTPQIQTLAIDLRIPTTVYAGTSFIQTSASGLWGGVFKSTDGGATWSLSAEGLPLSTVGSLVIDSVDSETLYAATRDEGVFISRDGASSWQPFNQGLDSLSINRLIAHPTDRGHLYAATESGLYELRNAPAPPSGLQVRQSVSGNLFPGGTAEFEITLQHPGGPQGAPAEFRQTLPQGLKLVQAQAGLGTVVPGPSFNSVSWEGEIPSEGTALIRIEARVEDRTAGRNLACQGMARIDLDRDGAFELQALSDDPSTPESDDPTSFEVQAGDLQDQILAVPRSLGTRSTFTGIAASNLGGFENRVHVASLSREGDVLDQAQLEEPLARLSQRPFLAREAAPVADAVAIEAESAGVDGFFMIGSDNLDRLDGIAGRLVDAQSLFIPWIRNVDQGETVLFLFNADRTSDASTRLSLQSMQGAVLAETQLELGPLGSFTGSVDAAFGEDIRVEDAFLALSSDRPIRGFALIADEDTFTTVAAQPTVTSERFWAPHYFYGEQGASTQLRVLNPGRRTAFLTIQARDDQAGLLPQSRLEIPAGQLVVADLAELLGEAAPASGQGSLEIEADGGGFGAYTLLPSLVAMITYDGGMLRTRTSLPLADGGSRFTLFLQVAQSSDIFQGLAIFAPQETLFLVQAWDPSGENQAPRGFPLPLSLKAGERRSALLDEILGPDFSQVGGFLTVEASAPVIVYSLLGGRGYLSAIVGRKLDE